MFSFLIYILMFGKEKVDVHGILLIGMVIGVMFSSLTNFMQMMIDPNEFFIVQNSIVASFNSVNEGLILIGTVLIGVVILASLRLVKYLDIMALRKRKLFGAWS